MPADYKFRLFFPSSPSRIKRRLPLVLPHIRDPPFFARRMKFADGSHVIYRTTNPISLEFIPRDQSLSHVWNPLIAKRRITNVDDFSDFKRLYGDVSSYEQISSMFNTDSDSEVTGEEQ